MRLIPLDGADEHQIWLLVDTLSTESLDCRCTSISPMSLFIDLYNASFRKQDLPRRKAG